MACFINAGNTYVESDALIFIGLRVLMFYRMNDAGSWCSYHDFERDAKIAHFTSA